MESIQRKQFNRFIQNFQFTELFNQLGWNFVDNRFPKKVGEITFTFDQIAEKAGFAILICQPNSAGLIPDAQTRKKIHNEIKKLHYEHLIIFVDKAKSTQHWELQVRETNKPTRIVGHKWKVGQAPELLYQKLSGAFFTFEEDEEGGLTIVDVVQRIKENFGANAEKITKKFYQDFKKQHTKFLDFIEGIDDNLPDKDNTNKQWYASLMLNRLMFCYFIQKKGFLDQDKNYLKNKLTACQHASGEGHFYSFYRHFLLELFHDGLAKPLNKRNGNPPVEMGNIPYLNGGLFDVHELEEQFKSIQIDDDAFEAIFDFFDEWEWHLDTREHTDGKTINPDVIGYIFEKYINDRAAMGAYYTKEDITDYIGKNTIIPFLFDETERNYKEAFTPDSEIWQTLKNSNNLYIYDAVKYGIPENGGMFDDLPDEVKAGFIPDLEQKVVDESTETHLWEIRRSWNQRAPENIGLPTEIYRELIERRKRYSDIKGKIERGEITHINDFITYNLNIRQFAQDFIETTSDPAFIRHFYKAINKITILDPTCGSGAFLFAAMNILEPLYETCLKRMEEFTDEQPGKHKFFEETLAKIEEEDHPSLKYYIYKTIILNNLYGVDIMKEAVEIAKLRLFLKLVALVDPDLKKTNYGLEPLPDVDFNIRAGNTLVGFATEQELLDTIRKKDALFAEEKLKEFKEEFAELNKVYRHFQDAQLVNNQGTDGFRQAKHELQKRLGTLNENLNIYLASNYGITNLDNVIEIEVKDEKGKKEKKKVNQFQHWLATHQPFHWFAEYYQIVAIDGGFDVIIGNPPYVVYNDIKDTYTLQGYDAFEAGDLFAFVMERSIVLTHTQSTNGFIIPMSCFTVDGFKSIQKLYYESMLNLHISNWSGDAHPSKLFEGVDKRLHIVLSKRTADKGCNVFSTIYSKWYSEERKFIFENKPKYKEVDFINDLIFKSSISKLNNNIDRQVVTKIKSGSSVSSKTINSATTNVLYYTRKVSFFLQFLDFVPNVEDESGAKREPSELKKIYFDTQEQRDYALCGLSSSIFYWYYIVNSDCRNLNKREVYNFPLPKMAMFNTSYSKLVLDLMSDYNNNSFERTVDYKSKGKITVQYFNFRPSKPIIDQIDTVLAQYYGFTEEELDFIINYDIKYRMGKALFGEEDDGGDDDEE